MSPNVMEKRKWWFTLSCILLVPGIVSLIVWHLRLGIDFTGGSLSEYTSSVTATDGTKTITSNFSAEGVKNIQVSTSNDGKETLFTVKSTKLTDTEHTNIVRRLTDAKPSFTESSFESIDPQVGADVTRKAVEAIIFASIAIILYIAYSFRRVPKPASSWQFGVFAVIALMHDVAFIIGFFSLMSHFFGWQVQSEFVTAVLTVMGFSVHDTIVTFDRVRENLRRYPGATFKQVANISVAQTMSRSLNTSLTVILVLLAVVTLGGSSIRVFTATLLVGIAVGTYSSIFVATALLDWYQDFRHGRQHRGTTKKATKPSILQRIRTPHLRLRTKSIKNQSAR